MTLDELFPPGMLEAALRDRLIVTQKHPSEPLTILNYSDRCQYQPGSWNVVTRQCRGLIHDDRGRIVARPFRKFFNYGDTEGGSFDPTAAVNVTDKLDGSLGILYPSSTGWAIATRGSFDSEQARHATQLWRSRYSRFAPPLGWTMLFEIIYPTNRIVVDYAGLDDLILLGAVEIESGRSISTGQPPLSDWPGPVTERFAYSMLAEALSAPARRNAEGFVVHFPGSDERLKIKQADYVALHRIVTGLNERTVWEHLSAGKPLGELLEGLPDEFHGWTRDVAAKLLAKIEAAAAEVEVAYAAIIASLPPGYARRDFALIAKEHSRRSQLFARLDGDDYRPSLWKEIYPPPSIGPRGLAPTEVTA